MIDEFQDTNAVQLEILEALERDNLFAVGDEFQSIYRFRHADVGIFRAPRAALDRGVRGLAVNFRSREELLDVLNAAFAPELGERFSPLRAGRRRRRRTPTARCGCSRSTRPPARRRSSCSSRTPRAGTSSRRGSAWPAAATSRGAAPRPA